MNEVFYPQVACGGLICPAAARARALTPSMRSKPSESAWLNSPIASIEAFASEYNECGTSFAEAKITFPLCRLTTTTPVTSSVTGRRASRHARAKIEKVALIDLLGDQQRQLIEKLAGASIQNQLEQVGVAGAEQFHAGRLINTAGFDADETVFDQVIADADAVTAADLVGATDRLVGVDIFAIDGDGPAVFKAHGHFFMFVRGVVGMHPHAGRDE